MTDPTEAPLDRDILFAALERPLEERDSYLADACRGNAQLKDRISKLLRVAELDGSFMSKPVYQVGHALQDQQELTHGLRENEAGLMPATLEMQRDYAVGDSVGRYKLLELIGEGGMGIVYMASQRQPIRRVVALKLIKPGMDSRQVVARFAAERQALALMNHAHIAKVLDAGTTETGRPYFVMDLVRGIPITSFCDQHKLSIPERLQLFIKVCEAVQHAHQKGVIHRDLKPSNILVELEDVKAVPKVIDFGVAKATHQSVDNTLHTGFAQLIGTPLYMSPEQASLNGLDIDTRSDIYSLGVVLYELLTGETPFNHRALKDAGFDGMRRIICEQQPQRPSQQISTLKAENRSTLSSLRKVDPRQLALSMKRELDWIVMKTLEKDRSRRYESASELALDVQRYLDDERVRACPASTGYRLNILVRRYRSLLTALVIIFFSMLSGTVIATWQAVKATKAQALATARLTIADNARLNERKARDNAERLTQETRELLSKGYATAAAECIDQNDLMQSLSWFVKAMKVDATDQQSVSSHRTSLSMVLDQCPKLIGMFDTGIPRDSNAFLVSTYDVMRFDSLDRPTAIRMSDGTAQMHDVASGQPVGRAFKAPSPLSGYCKLSPLGGYVLVVSPSDWALWDTSGNKLISVDASENPRHFSFSPNDMRLIVQSKPGNVTCWDTKTGQLTASEEFDLSNWSGAFPPVVGNSHALIFNDFRLGNWVANSRLHTHNLGLGVTNAQLSHDDKRFVVTSIDTVARLFGVDTLEECAIPLQHGTTIRAAYFSPDDSIIATIGDDVAKIWNSATGTLLTSSLQHDGDIWDASFSKDGRYLITSSWDTTARIWDVATGRLAYPILAHHTQVASAQFDSSGRTVLTVTSDGIIHYWDLASSMAPCVLFDDGGPGFDVNFTTDGHQLLTAGAPCRLWNAERGTADSEPLNHGETVYSAVVDTRKRRVLTTGREPKVCMWNIEQSDSPVKMWERNDRLLRYADLSPDASYVLSWNAAKRVQMHRVDSGDLLAWPVTRAEGIEVSAFSSKGRYLATSHHAAGDRRITNGALGLWNGANGEPLTALTAHRGPIRFLTFSEDETKVATVSGYEGGGQGEIRIFNADTGKECGPTLRGQSEFLSVRFDSSGERLVTTASDQSARVWNTSNGLPLTPPMSHRERLVDGDFSRDGYHVLTVTGRGTKGRLVDEPITVRLWNAQTGLLVSPPLQHSDSGKDYTSWSYSRNGRNIAVASGDGAKRVWQLTKEANSQEDLERLAQLYSSRKHDERGLLSFVDATEKISIWKELRSRHPEWFSPTRLQVLAWLYGEAIRCQRSARYTEALVRLNELINLLPAENVGLRLRRVQCHIATGELDLAGQELGTLIDEGRTDFPTYRCAAVVALRSKNAARFRSICSIVLQQFGQSQDPMLAESITWLVALESDAVDDYEPVVSIARTASDADGATAVILLRAGKPEVALEHMKLARAGNMSSEARNAYVLALILDALGRPTESRAALLGGNKISERLAAEPKLALPWDDKLALEILRTEADRQISQTSTLD